MRSVRGLLPELLHQGHRSAPGVTGEGAEGKEAAVPENPCRGRIQPLRSLVHCGERRAGRGMLGPSIILQRGGHVDPQQHPGIFFYPPASHAGVAATKGMLELVSLGTPSSMGGEPLGAESAAAWGGYGGCHHPWDTATVPSRDLWDPKEGHSPQE